MNGKEEGGGVPTLAFSIGLLRKIKIFKLKFFSSIFNPEYPHYQIWKFKKDIFSFW